MSARPFVLICADDHGCRVRRFEDLRSAERAFAVAERRGCRMLLLERAMEAQRRWYTGAERRVCP